MKDRQLLRIGTLGIDGLGLEQMRRHQTCVAGEGGDPPSGLRRVQPL